jgi:hypothetical protein
MGRQFGLAAADGCHDQLGKTPVVENQVLGMLSGQLCRGQRILVAAEAVVEHRVRPLSAGQPVVLAPGQRLVRSRLDQLGDLRFPVLPGEER